MQNDLTEGGGGKIAHLSNFGNETKGKKNCIYSLFSS